MYGCLYVINLFKQKIVSQNNDLFAAVTLHNLFCHRLSDHFYCTNRPFIHVLRKDTSTLSRRSKRTPFRKYLLNENITQKQLEPYYMTKFCHGSFTVVTCINCSVI